MIISILDEFQVNLVQEKCKYKKNKFQGTYQRMFEIADISLILSSMTLMFRLLIFARKSLLVLHDRSWHTLKS